MIWAMNVALIADTAWLDEELSQFHYMVVGLIDERLRIVQVIPQGLPIEEWSLFGERLTWAESRWPHWNHRRLAQLDAPLEAADIHLIHAMDSRLWAGAVALGGQMNVPVVLGANAAGAVQRVEKLVRSADPARLAFAAATEPIAQALREKVDPAVVVETVPTGVHVGATPAGDAPDEALCAIVSGDGAFDEAYHALLEGMVEVCKQHPQTQFFMDGQGAEQHQIWKAASKLGLLPNLSLIPRRLGHREMLLRADVLIHPQALGQSRSMTLQAMAHGLAVVAQHDPWLDYLVDQQTCWAVEQPTAQAWAQHLLRLIDQPEDGRQLGQRARDWVHEHRLVSTQIAGILNLYRRLTGETIPFPGSATNHRSEPQAP